MNNVAASRLGYELRMFERETVFVLGAGASWHYGYPTGEELVAEITSGTEEIANYCQRRRACGFNAQHLPLIFQTGEPYQPADPWKAWNAAISKCNDLTDRLKHTAPLVIDYFLRWNPHLKDLGRTMIAFALLRREAQGAGTLNWNRAIAEPGAPIHNFPYHRFKDNWIRFVIHQLLLKCGPQYPLAANHVHFVTFNYDLSLERALSKALRGAQFLEPAEVDSFLNEGLAPRFVHIYGALRPIPNAPNLKMFSSLGMPTGNLDEATNANKLLDLCFEAGKDLRVIEPDEKGLGKDSEGDMSITGVMVIGKGAGAHNDGLPRNGLLAGKLLNLDGSISIHAFAPLQCGVRPF